MKKAICCFLGALFLLQTGSAQSSQNPDDTSIDVSYEMPFELRDGFLVVFEGRIGDLQKLKFVLDTGASQSVVDRRVARRLSLTHWPGRVFSFDKYIRAEWAEFPVVQFGAVEVHNMPLMVADLGNSWGFPGHADAIIGLDLLRRCQGFSIDYHARKLIFRVASATGTSSAPLQTPAYLTTKILVQGQLTRLLVDTGMNGILLYEDRLRKRVPNVVLEHEKDDVRLGYLHVKQAKLPGVVLNLSALEPIVSLIKGPSESPLSDVDGYLGTDALNAQQVEFDFEANTLTWNEYAKLQ